MIRRQHAVIIGAGPAGLAPLFAAANTGTLSKLLLAGITIVEQQSSVGTGTIGRYGVNSDSSAQAFLDVLSKCQDVRLAPLYSDPVSDQLRHLGKSSVPLTLVSEFLGAAGTLLCNLIHTSERGQVLTGYAAQHIQRLSPDLWSTEVRDLSTGETFQIHSDFVLIASGGHQPSSRLSEDVVADVPLLPRYAGKVLQSDAVLAHTGTPTVVAALKGITAPKVVIVGGSTSAGAVALRLLDRTPELSFGAGGVTMMHRRPLRIYYESEQLALEENYQEFTPDDVCALTGAVHRLAGFRLETRELIMRVLGIGNRPPEPRLKLFPLKQHGTDAARKVLDEADLLIAALGYRPRLLPVFDENMDAIELLEPSEQRWSVVDGCCRLLTSKGEVLPGLFAMGLAVGPGSDSSRGGEREFTGQVNSLWLWQHTLGQKIVQQWL